MIATTRPNRFNWEDGDLLFLPEDQPSNRHLPGDHNQKTHGHEGGGAPFTSIDDVKIGSRVTTTAGYSGTVVGKHKSGKNTFIVKDDAGAKHYPSWTSMRPESPAPAAPKSAPKSAPVARPIVKPSAASAAASASEATALTDAEFQSLGKNWGVNQIQGTEKYTFAYTKRGNQINDALRGSKSADKSFKSWTGMSTQEFAKELDVRLADSPPIPRDIVVYRGVGSDIGKKLVAGKALSDKGYMSTSASIDFPKAWAGDGNGGAILSITVPKGTRAAFPDFVHDYKGIPPKVTSQFNPMSEIILPRGTSLKVNRVDSKGVIHATAVPGDWNASAFT